MKKEPSGAAAGRATLRLRVTAAAERMARAGHPWIFAESVREQNRPGETGELAVVFDRADRFLCVGLYDAPSPIRLRVLHAGKPAAIDAAWWRGRAEGALARRRGLFDAQTTGFRLINGESDGWPGLILDQYGDTRVVKLYTAAWLPRLNEIAALLHGDGRLVLRLSRNIQQPALEKFQLSDGALLQGSPPDAPAPFLESGLRFESDVVRGQKTGFFLDQRENRRQVEKLSNGRAVLNLFSYTGGFSLYAARGGAAGVCSLDLSEHALAAARRIFSINQDQPAVAACPHDTIRADAFDWLRQRAPRQFDLIIIDPPSLAAREAEKPGAMAAYARLIESSLARLRPGGILVAASCSAHVTAAEFFALAGAVAAGSGRRFNELLTTGHPPDHPAAFAEAQYLKCIYFRFTD